MWIVAFDLPYWINHYGLQRNARFFQKALFKLLCVENKCPLYQSIYSMMLSKVYFSNILQIFSQSFKRIMLFLNIIGGNDMWETQFNLGWWLFLLFLHFTWYRLSSILPQPSKNIFILFYFSYNTLNVCLSSLSNVDFLGSIYEYSFFLLL